MTPFEELEQLRQKITIYDPETIRKCVAIVKELGSDKYRIPNYELPSDSFIELTVLKVIEEANKDLGDKLASALKGYLEWMNKSV